MTLRAATVMIDCVDASALAGWYVQVMGGEIVADHGSLVITRVDGVSMNLGFQQVPEPKVAKSRVHIDFLATDRAAEVQRLVDSGAAKVGDHSLGAFEWTVLQDLEGNEFCVAQALAETG
jgi:catechol-2,3-dioxygenase